jgi:DNA-nicking Smr family endonuclease
MSGKDERRRSLSEDERTLWTTFTKPIKPLTKRPAAKPDDATTPSVKPRKTAVSVGAPPLAAPAKKAPPPLAPRGPREKAKVARGRAGIDARLDLLGHTQAEAHCELLRFLRRASDSDKRMLLVITGKSGVLRQQVPHWLALPEFRTLVIGFEPAAIRHGGEGALYVRIRRARS